MPAPLAPDREELTITTEGGRGYRSVTRSGRQPTDRTSAVDAAAERDLAIAGADTVAGRRAIVAAYRRYQEKTA
jgi:hypothetical protein